MPRPRILVLGGAGMLGHKLWQLYRDRFDTYVTVRSSLRSYARDGLFDSARTIEGVDANDFDAITRAIATTRPDAIINAIGVIKQLPGAHDPILTLQVNALLPHRLAQLASACGVRFVHISTDCVFSGRKGNYTEADASDAEDLYGRTKYLGEVVENGALTLRTSIIGRELSTRNGLVEWFLSNRHGRVRGYTDARFSGLTTAALAEILAGILEHHPALNGLYHLSSEPIAKYELLCRLRDAFATGTAVEPDATVKIDRTLDSTKLMAVLDRRPPTWDEMIRAMAEDSTPYDEWRSGNAAR